MGIFDFLTGNDRSTNWIDLGKHPLLVSLAEPAINGVRLGSPADDLSRLGQPSNKRPFKEERFLFEKLGIVVEIENGLVSYFGLPVSRDKTDGIGPSEFSLRFLSGFEIELNSATAVASVLENLPAPAGTDSSRDETIYTVHVKDYCMELEVSPEGKMRRVNFFPAR